MNPSHSSNSQRLKVGVFTFFGLLMVGAVTIYVNHKPYWWKPCQLVHVNVEDATGLKMKSPIRSLGLEIGYLKTVELTETYVRLGICITAPVEILPSTRAYIRGEGFLGDKFVELKPVKYIGSASLDWSLIPSAWAEEDPSPNGSPRGASRKEIPVGERSEDVQQLVNRVDQLVGEMTSLTSNLRQAIKPEELQQTMRQLNKALENASKTLSPQGALNQTAQRTLSKLEDAIDQLRAQLTRINQGQGSLGMLLNDPEYAKEIKLALENLNKLLNKVSNVRFVVDIGGEEISAYQGGRGWFRLGIWPKPDRYYLLGVSVDPRGKNTDTTTTTTAGGTSVTVSTHQVESTAFLFTAMVGKVFWKRLDLSVGALHGDADVSTQFNLGPLDREELFQVRDDVYSHSSAIGVDNRLSFIFRPFMGLYVRAGMESIRRVNSKLPFFYGAGISFDDEDIKLLFTLR